MRESDNKTLVKRRLVMINAIIILTSVIGIASILEVARGVGFHESNIQHLGLTSKLNEKITALTYDPDTRLADIRELLVEVRLEPLNCLNSMNPILEFGLKILGTHNIKGICETDLAIVDEALHTLTMLDTGEIERELFIEKLNGFGDIMHSHSFQFRPLVSKTVDVLLIIAGVILALKGLAVSLVSVSSSRSIIRQFDNIIGMQKELSVKNGELQESVATLEQQKEEIAAAQLTAEHNALHDTLTGLPNRRYLDKHLAETIERGSRFAVIHLDLDGFKLINDTRGHDAGDHVLHQVALRLQQQTAQNAFIARVGGDEFVLVVLLTESTGNDNNPEDSIETVKRLASDLIASMRKPVSYEGFDCRFTASLGIAFNGLLEPENTEQSILINADLALYHQKLHDKNGFTIYNNKLREELTEKHQLADQIHAALANREFIPFFQPQFYTDSLEVSGVEALVRWQHPQRGLLTPDKFLGIAEEMGVLGDIDRQVFEHAYEHFTRWRKAGIEVPKLSVNISLNRLLDPGTFEQLEDYDLSDGSVSFELLESIMLDGCDDNLQSAIDRLIDMGIELELDDFGSGHASILGLLALRPSRFKIDRQLISAIHESRPQRALVRSIIDIGKSLDLEMIAEGVETPEQVQILTDLGCQKLQGFHFSKPLSNDDFLCFMENRSWQEAA